MALSFLLGTVPFCFSLTGEKEKKKRRKKDFNQVINLFGINGA